MDRFEDLPDVREGLRRAVKRHADRQSGVVVIAEAVPAHSDPTFIYRRNLANLCEAVMHRVVDMENAMGMREPWPLHGCLAKMIEATEHLLNDHQCDNHGHEEYRAASEQAKALLPQLHAVLEATAKLRAAVVANT